MKKIVKGWFCLVSVLAAGIVRASVPSDGLAAAVDAAADGAVTTNATTGGSCVLFADPGFCDAVGGDFHLLRTSPLVNAGDRLDYTKDDVDFDGNGRITGFNTRKRTKCLPDLGCYESPWGVPGMILLVR